MKKTLLTGHVHWPIDGMKSAKLVGHRGAGGRELVRNPSANLAWFSVRELAPLIFAGWRPKGATAPIIIAADAAPAAMREVA